ncbi:hypothetical protein [Arthrobacter sp. OY3WO11]|uniref:hypothetical protein n=1 Tax=Arthrobacter sp. OY3WO11 TaxID=1835723 RepID=UPI0007D03BD7|nr:hypothetical protein [Arthrobacter sp. OY3WO11]OAE01892.1 hypothetical protein A6A22_11025 [Arthrobacter sp. OY3WO11]
MSNEYNLQQRQSNGLAQQRSYPADIIPTTTAATYEMNLAWTARYRQRQGGVLVTEAIEIMAEVDRKVDEAVMARPRIEQAALLFESTLMMNMAQIQDRYMKGYR